LALGAEQQAMRELERALPLAPNPAIAAQLTAKLREFSARRRTLH
jgi:regulator of sirC expression with transglutaminase-like and TPR domain